MMKVIITFHNFGNASKTVLLLILTSTPLQLTYIQNVIPGCVHMDSSLICSLCLSPLLPSNTYLLLGIQNESFK